VTGKKNPNKHRNKGKREIKMKRKKIKTGKKERRKAMLIEEWRERGIK
jgi:hypothetical protein